MNFYVYILKCSDGSYYTGHTENLELRLSEHNLKKYSGYTSTRLPVELVFHELFTDRDAAFKVERQIKGWNKRKKEILIKFGWSAMKGISNF